MVKAGEKAQMTDLLATLLQVLIIEGWIIAALLCWKYETWKPEPVKADKDGFIPLNRRAVDMVLKQL